MIERRKDLQKLIAWKDEPILKVVTGIRRCGKSTLLKLYHNYLMETGVGADQILAVNFEELGNEALQDYKTLYTYLTERLCGDKMTYIFLDEIQKVDGFEKAVDSLYVKENVDIYITGSNSRLLSGELATLLSGRYVEIRMLPLSFAEFYQSQGGGDKDRLFAEYLESGSFPYIATMDRSREKTDMYLEGIYNTVIVKDIEERRNRKEKDPNKRKITDIVLLKNICRFLADSVGSPISVKRIADYITSSGMKVSQNTVDDYIEALVQAYVFYRAERYDVRGKQLLKQNGKLYIADLGLRRYLQPKSRHDPGHSLENVIYLELLRRGYEVTIGKVVWDEVDFVAKKEGIVEYYQTAASMTEQTTFEREITPLRKIKDNYPKKILTLDRWTPGNYEGIEVLNAVDWLLNDGDNPGPDFKDAADQRR